MTQEIFVGHHDRSGDYERRSCTKQKLDETNIERCLGIDELRKFVWY